MDGVVGGTFIAWGIDGVASDGTVPLGEDEGTEGDPTILPEVDPGMRSGSGVPVGTTMRGPLGPLRLSGVPFGDEEKADVEGYAVLAGNIACGEVGKGTLGVEAMSMCRGGVTGLPSKLPAPCACAGEGGGNRGIGGSSSRPGEGAGDPSIVPKAAMPPPPCSSP
jgi:hypothetical protein